MAANWMDLRGLGEGLDLVGGRFGAGNGTTIMAQIPLAKVRPRGKRLRFLMKTNLKVYERH